MSLRGHVISSIYSLSSKLKTKLEVISRYHKVQCSPVSLREIAEKAKSPETSA